MSCNSNTNEFPLSSKEITLNYAKLYRMACSSKDTFVHLYTSNNSVPIQKFFWGKSARFAGYEKIEGRTKLVSMSSVFIGMLESLQTQERIIAVDNADYISMPKTRMLAKKGKIVSIAPTGKTNAEQLHSLQPHLVFSYFLDANGMNTDLLIAKKSNCQMIFIQNYLEQHPLGRSEWILFFGHLLGKAQLSVQIFNEIKEHYEELVAKTSAITNKPKVACNAPFAGVWDLPNGKSYMAQFIKDAGGSCITTNETETGKTSLPLVEAVKRANEAQYWINPGLCNQYSCLIGMDKRLAELPAFQKKHIYNYKVFSEKSPNPIWDYGVLRADLVLKDLFSIFHPDASEHEFIFYSALNP